MGKPINVTNVLFLFLMVLGTFETAEASFFKKLFGKKNSKQHSSLGEKTSTASEIHGADDRDKIRVKVYGEAMVPEEIRNIMPDGAPFKLEIVGDAVFETEVIKIGSNLPKDQPDKVEKVRRTVDFNGQPMPALRGDEGYGIRVNGVGEIDHTEVEDFIFSRNAKNWIIGPVAEILPDQNLYIIKSCYPGFVDYYVITDPGITKDEDRKTAYIFIGNRFAREALSAEIVMPSYYPSQERIKKYYPDGSDRQTCLLSMQSQYFKTGGKVEDLQKRQAPAPVQVTGPVPVPNQGQNGLQQLQSMTVQDTNPAVTTPMYQQPPAAPAPSYNFQRDAQQNSNLLSIFDTPKPAPAPAAAPAQSKGSASIDGLTSGLLSPADLGIE